MNTSVFYKKHILQFQGKRLKLINLNQTMTVGMISEQDELGQCLFVY